MIEFKNVSASYDGELAVLADVSFTVNDGDFVAFVGTNGAGKSTTMRLANGLLKPTSGEVLIDGVPTTSLKTSELARRIGFLFQNPDRQICCNTVREELMFGFKALGEEGPEAEARVDAMIERFGFDADAEPYLLNRGTRQLLALASIIVLAPPTIILDEPTTGLDFRECVKVMDVVRELKARGYTLYLLSNAARRQHTYWHDIPGSECFSGTLISADVHLLKPEAAIYQALFDKFDLTAASCLFVDDFPPNIEAAENAGMQGIVFHDAGQLRVQRNIARHRE